MSPQRDYLTNAGCDEMQSSCLPNRCPPADVEAFLSTRFEDTVRMKNRRQRAKASPTAYANWCRLTNFSRSGDRVGRRLQRV